LKGMKTACDLINSQVNQVLQGKDLFLYKKIDGYLNSFKTKREAQGEKIGPNITSAVSNALFYACAKAVNSQYPFMSMYKANMVKGFVPPYIVPAPQGEAAAGSATPGKDAAAALVGSSLPKLIINVFNGGKESGSKVKFSRFYLIIDVNPVDLAKIAQANEEAKDQEGAVLEKTPNIHEAYIKFSQAVEKSCAGTKQGLAAFKRGVDGAFFNAYDNINECFKVMEEAIAATGANTDGRKYLKIGVNTDAHSYYLEEANKYDWDGAKVQYDEDQLIDFYEKLINEHPLLEYVEDAFTPSHIQAHKKFLAKLKTSHPNV